MVQYEVAGLEIDRDMIRPLAKRLAKEGPDANHIRTRINELLESKGRIVAALLRSPLVGADLGLSRDRAPPRDIDL
ncbi:hypothetical protein IVB30_20515 [Bradyrhizobium sp. 200]|nr:hypothetical protein IVB30_20515 [Bradyrhizobium sp. 200]